MSKNKLNNTNGAKQALRFLFINLAAMVAVVAAVLFITFRWINHYTEHGVAVLVPNVTKMQENEAIARLAESDLVGVVEERTYVKGVPVGEVISQRPALKAKVKRGRKVYLNVSSGNQPMVSVPDIADNSSLREAESRLRAAGFKLTPHEVVPGDLDWVYGIRYNGRELQGAELVPQGAELTIIVGGGMKVEADTLAASVEDGWF